MASTVTAKKANNSHKDHANPAASRPHRSTLSAQKTEIVIHVYDLLPPGRLASALWVLGVSLLHSGVVIRGQEYAYGGHEHGGVTGVYRTAPGTEPPGATFKGAFLHGFTLQPAEEIDRTIQQVSTEFLGRSYNLLSRNCNHFTSVLCQRLTARPAPSWLNRAAGIGVALPCVVPREWIEPPDHETADGELIDNEDDERSMMLQNRRSEERGSEVNDGPDSLMEGGRQKLKGNPAQSHAFARDTSGRTVPSSERAPNS